MTAPDTVPCEGCRRTLSPGEAQPAYLEDGRTVWQCPECRGVFMLTRQTGATFETIGTPQYRAFDAMLGWWDAVADRGEADVQLSWMPLDADINPAGEPVILANTYLEGDGLTRDGRRMLAAALPPDELLWPLWWHPQEPLTWTLWDAIPVNYQMTRDGRRVEWREIRTRAIDYGDPGNPDMYGPPPQRASASVACAWWAVMLTPIHMARVALLAAGVEGAAKVRISARDRDILGKPARVSDPGFADALTHRAAASRRVLDALGWQEHPRWHRDPSATHDTD